MTIEELVRNELRSVAEQVVVPPLPPLDDHRRNWRLVVAAAAVVALVIGGVTVLLGRGTDRPERPIEKPKVVHVDGSAPTIPWIDGENLYAGGERIPGRWAEMVSGGGIWVARRHDLHAVWGRGTEQHDLGKVGWFFGVSSVEPLGASGPFLSPGGRYVAYGGDQGNMGRSPLRLLDTQTGRSTALPDRYDKHDIDAVTDTGLLLTSIWPDASDPEGRPEVREHYVLGVGRAPVRLEALGGELLSRTGAPGLMLRDADGVVWVVDLVGSRVRRAVGLGPFQADTGAAATSLSPDRKWLLDLRWAVEQEEPSTVSVTAVDAGRTTSIAAPKGWTFAPRLAPGFWESAGTLVTWVVEGQSRAYRLARCAPAVGKCVLVEDS